MAVMRHVGGGDGIHSTSNRWESVYGDLIFHCLTFRLRRGAPVLATFSLFLTRETHLNPDARNLLLKITRSMNVSGK